MDAERSFRINKSIKLKVQKMYTKVVKIGSILLPRFGKQLYGWTSKGYLNVTPYGVLVYCHRKNLK